jgi:alcohol dehydrogenase, propanol-preferring
MRAVQLVQWMSEPELVEVPVPTPGPGQVLLRVDAAGLCHSDLHLMEWPAEIMPFDPPFTLGHETAGTVAALGPGATGVAEGDRVLVHSRWGCGRCRPCVQGEDNLCQRSPAELGGHGGGIGFDGGLAEYMLVPAARYLVDIDGLEPERAAPLSDAALTPYHAIKQAGRHLRPGATVVVIGVGGIGHMAVQLLRALTPVRIVAVDLRTDALELARGAGAELTLEAAELTPERLRAELGLGGAAVVFDCVASEATLQLAAGAVGIGGHISYVGRGGGSLAVSPATLPFECSVSLPSWGSIPELSEIVDLARSGLIDVEVHRVGLEDAVKTYRQLRRGEIIGRAVALPGATNGTVAFT